MVISKVQQFIADYIETGDDGHDFMPRDVIEHHAGDSEKKYWIQEQIENMISENDSKVSDEDAELYLNNKAKIIKAAFVYICS